MAKKRPIQSNNLGCGCIIDDLLEKSDGKGEKKKDDMMCGAHESDIEVFIDPDVEKTSYDFYLRRLTDGLPIIPPTGERVQKFLDYANMGPDEIIAVLPPKHGNATLKKIAVNSVMAGCLPIFMPVVQHSIKAMANEKFNLTGVNATTHPVAVCTILNGPLSTEIGASCDAGCLGPGNIANASIGRAIRLCLINIAGAVPGIGDHATMGSPAKYSYCFREAESESPWEPLHYEKGFEPGTSTVTVMAVEAPHNVNDHRSKHAEELLETISHTATTAGCNNSHVPGEILVIMSPEHAATISRDGWSKEEVKYYIHENSVIPVELGDRGGRKLDKRWIIDENVKITRSPNDVVVVTAGGTGRHTMISHGFGTSSESVTELIKLKDGTVASSVLDFKER